MNSLVKSKINELKSLCKLYRVSSLYLFGSAIKSDLQAKSDLDFLISFDKGLSISEYTDNYFSLQYRLRSLFNREIDLVTENSLSNPFFIAEIEKNKELIYGA